MGALFTTRFLRCGQKPSFTGHLPFRLIVLIEWHTFCIFAVGKDYDDEKLAMIEVDMISIPGIEMRYMTFDVG